MAHSHHHPFADQFLSYAGAGHYIEPPYLATDAFVNPQVGGDAKDQEHADADSWSHILRLLAARLGTRPAATLRRAPHIASTTRGFE